MLAVNTNQELAIYETIQSLEYRGLMHFYLKDFKLYVHVNFELGNGVTRFIREHYWEIHEVLHKTRCHVALC